MNIELIELFSGIGGFAKGFIDAGYNITKHQFSEIDKHAIANYKYNFNEAEYIGSVTDFRGKRTNRTTVLTFGSPCQDFSLAGKQRGLEGERSVLILEAIRIIRELQPSVFIWENVKGTFSSNNSADFWAILAAFANIGGYRLEWQLLNTSWFLPQNRERIYLIGHLADRSKPGVFPFSESDKRTFEGATNPAIVRAITAGGKSGGHHSGMTLITHYGHKDKPPKSHKISPTLKAQSHGHEPMITTIHNKDIIKVGKVSRTDAAKEIRRESMKNGVDYTPFQGKKLEFIESDIMNTVTCATMKDNTIEQNKQIRRLTEIECERLQGFPDDWTKYGIYENGIKEIPKTQRYKLCGNAVTTKVVAAIADRLIFI